MGPELGCWVKVRNKIREVICDTDNVYCRPFSHTGKLYLLVNTSHAERTVFSKRYTYFPCP